MRFTGFFIILSVFWIGYTAAFAQDIGGAPCIPGVPCKVNLTTNDPNEKDEGPNDADAPNNPKRESSDACDADFMNQIYSKAWLEAERQNVIGEILIRKPDSVLEYSCFNQMASLIAEEAGPLFTESDEWDDEDVDIDGEINTGDIDKAEEPDRQERVKINTYMEDDRLDNAIEEVVLKSLKEYLDSNFDHAFLGGAASDDPQTGEARNFNTAGIDRVTNQPYNCRHMTLINFDSKCTNINEDTSFYTFEELSVLSEGDNDPRQQPEECDGITALKHFDEIIPVAENRDFQYAAFDRAMPTFLERIIDSRECGDLDAIPTGITYTTETFFVNPSTGKVTTPSGPQLPFRDAVCAKPGCFYSGQGAKCE